MQRPATLQICVAALMAALTAVSAQLKFNLGPVPYTMQNFAFVLAGLLLRPKFAAASQLLYLLLIAAGLPAAAGFSGGVGVLLGYTAGYLWAFPAASAAMSWLSRRYARFRPQALAHPTLGDYAALLALSLVAAAPVYALGFAVFYFYAVQPTPLGRGLMAWARSAAELVGLGWLPTPLLLFVASVAIFVPEDLFVDHVLAIAVGTRVLRLLKSWGLA